jgi:hypothetical protein
VLAVQLNATCAFPGVAFNPAGAAGALAAGVAFASFEYPDVPVVFTAVTL